MISELESYIELRYFPIQGSDEYIESLPVTIRRQLYREIHSSVLITKIEIDDYIITSSLKRIIRHHKRIPDYRPSLAQISDILRKLLIKHYEEQQ